MARRDIVVRGANKVVLLQKYLALAWYHLKKKKKFLLSGKGVNRESLTVMDGIGRIEEGKYYRKFLTVEEPVQEVSFSFETGGIFETPAGDQVDFSDPNLGLYFTLVEIPDGNTLLSGEVATKEGFDTIEYSISIGDSSSPTRYIDNENIKFSNSKFTFDINGLVNSGPIVVTIDSFSKPTGGAATIKLRHLKKPDDVSTSDVYGFNNDKRNFAQGLISILRAGKVHAVMLRSDGTLGGTKLSDEYDLFPAGTRFLTDHLAYNERFLYHRTPTGWVSTATGYPNSTFFTPVEIIPLVRYRIKEATGIRFAEGMGVIYRHFPTGCTLFGATSSNTWSRVVDAPLVDIIDNSNIGRSNRTMEVFEWFSGEPAVIVRTSDGRRLNTSGDYGSGSFGALTWIPLNVPNRLAELQAEIYSYANGQWQGGVYGEEPYSPSNPSGYELISGLRFVRNRSKVGGPSGLNIQPENTSRTTVFLRKDSFDSFAYEIAIDGAFTSFSLSNALYMHYPLGVITEYRHYIYQTYSDAASDIRANETVFFTPPEEPESEPNPLTPPSGSGLDDPAVFQFFHKLPQDIVVVGAGSLGYDTAVYGRGLTLYRNASFYPPPYKVKMSGKYLIVFIPQSATVAYVHKSEYNNTFGYELVMTIPAPVIDVNFVGDSSIMLRRYPTDPYHQLHRIVYKPDALEAKYELVLDPLWSHVRFNRHEEWHASEADYYDGSVNNRSLRTVYVSGPSAPQSRTFITSAHNGEYKGFDDWRYEVESPESNVRFQTLRFGAHVKHVAAATTLESFSNPRAFFWVLT